MAIWQCELYLDRIEASSRAYVQAGGEVEADVNSFDISVSDIALWIADRFRTRMAPRMSQVCGIESWGEENGNRIDVVNEPPKGITEITVRVDLREPDIDFLEDVIGLAIGLGCNIRFANGSVCMPTFDELTVALQKSDEFKFCSDPIGFLERLKRRDSTSLE